MTTTSEHDLDCPCGQPLDMIVPPIAAHCPRCGRLVTPAPALAA